MNIYLKESIHKCIKTKNVYSKKRIVKMDWLLFV
jgi:hypothetical protein